MPVDVVDVQRRHDRFQAGMMIWSGLSLTAVSLANDDMLRPWRN